MKQYLFILIGLIIFIPNIVNAQEYTFNVCKKGCTWNEENLNNLDMSYMEDNYPHFNKNEDKVIINFKDGNYSFIQTPTLSFDMEYRFGKGVYTFIHLSAMQLINLSITGENMNDTKIIANEGIQIYKCSNINIANLSMNIKNSANINASYYEDIFPSINIKNTNINYSCDEQSCDDFNIILSLEDSLNNDCETEIENVTMNSTGILNFYYYPVTHNLVDKVKIKNSDFSNTNINIFPASIKIMNPIYIDFDIINTKLKKVYVSHNNKLNIDCNSTFVGGIKKVYGTLSSGSFFSQNEYNLYGYWSDKAGSYSIITTETCKDKSIKINKKISLDEIKEEFGYDIDDTWTFDPEGIIELKNNNLVPLKVGKTKLSKEINGEVQSLRLEITSVDKSNQNIVNPKTMTPIFIILIITILILPITIIYKKKSMN